MLWHAKLLLSHLIHPSRKERIVMERIKNLNYYQKGIILLMILMSVIFAVIYPMTISKVGYLYHDTILVQSYESGATVYSGKIDGEQIKFTVSEDQSVVLQYGDKTYGPYTMKKDPTAVPKNEDEEGYMTGIEIRNGDQVFFRGGVSETADGYLLFDENGDLDNFRITYSDSDGVEKDENGNVIDPMEPSAGTIYELMNTPELTHKGEGIVWFGGVFICILDILFILFADEIFRWNLLFQIQNVEDAEPSEWQIAERYISWTILAIGALAIFIIGLQ